MKVRHLCAAILALSVPASLFALGLGELKVKSALGQPFKGEIEVIDVGSIPLSDIKISLASLEEFQRAGLDLNEVLSFIKFKIKRNKKGKVIVELTSAEHITEPYLQMVVDLAWANGQLYRAYTILLDPPHYKLANTKEHAYTSRPIVNAAEHAPVPIKKSENSPETSLPKQNNATYGPTIANENIWQIARYYAGDDVTLSQIVLAIVGTNSQAFTLGNLNGLKTGERLEIPSLEEIRNIPLDLADKEVQAHNTAWNSNQEIKHVLLPPYIGGEKGVSQFENKDSPKQSLITSIALPGTSTEQPINSTALPSKGLGNIINNTGNAISSVLYPINDVQMKAEVKVNSAAIDTLRAENELLKRQLSALAVTNDQLQKIMQQQSQAFTELKSQINQVVIERQGLKAQVNELNNESKFDWFNLLFILAALGVGTLLGWLLFNRRSPAEKEIEDYPVKPAFEPMYGDNKGEYVVITEPAQDTGSLENQQTAIVTETPLTDKEAADTAIDSDSFSTQDEKQANHDEEGLPASQATVPDNLSMAPIQELSTQLDSEESKNDTDEGDLVKGSQEIQDIEEAVPFETHDQEEKEETNYHDDSSQLDQDKSTTSVDEHETLELPSLDFSPELEQAILQDQAENPEEDKPLAAEYLPDSDEELLHLIHSDLYSDETENSERQAITTLLEETPTEPMPLAESSPTQYLNKSKTALETLLGLANTYIAMEDYEAAKQALDEVNQFGNSDQKARAKELFDKIPK